MKKIYDKKESFYRSKLEHLYNIDIVTDEDLKNLFTSDFVTFEENYLNIDSFKNQVLSVLYLYPYIAYESPVINDEVFDTFVDFTKNRYLEEKCEYDMKLSSCEIGKKEYRDFMDKLNKNYIYSSTVGINIFRKVTDVYVKE